MDKLYLKHPIKEISKKDGSVLSTIDYVIPRPLKTGDIIDVIDVAGEKLGTATAHFISRSTRLTVKQIRDDLDPEDFFALSEVVEGFLPASLRTGKPASSLSAAPSDTQPILTSGEPESSAGGLLAQ